MPTIPVAVLMVVCVAGAMLAINVRNILHAIFGLGITLVGLAGIYMYLNSPFLAAMQILIYVGGISVAMVFAVMVSQSISAVREGVPMWKRLVGLVPAVAFLALMVRVITTSTFGPKPEVAPEAWSLDAIGMALLTHYNLVFEMLSLVLLLAIMGAIAIARRDTAEEETS